MNKFYTLQYFLVYDGTKLAPTKKFNTEMKDLLYLCIIWMELANLE